MGNNFKTEKGDVPDEEDDNFEQTIERTRGEEEIVISETSSEVCSSSNKFTQQLYIQLNSKGNKENLILSGFGLSTAMAMIFLAARDEAFEEIQKCFRFHEDLEEHKSGYKDILAHLANCNSEDAKLNICQKIFVANRLDIPESFTKNVKNVFGADPTKMDLADPASADIVNGWVNEATAGKIKTIVDGDDFKQQNLTMLLNAIFFKSDWANKFDPKRTEENDFHLSGGDKVKAQLMTLDRVDLRSVFIKTLDGTAIELPYKGDRFSMVFILPEKKDGFDEMERRLGDVDLNNELNFGQHKSEFIITIPKFRVESTHHLEEPLKSLDVKTAFVQGRSNFGGISKVPNHETFLGMVRQKAVIEVDEIGTEAAAFSVVSVMDGSCLPQFFVCNRPFIFLVREKASGLVLFIGRMMNPAKK